MSEQKHTPGPWKANDLGYVGTAESESGWTLISIPAGEIEADGHFIKLPPDEEQKANTRLIAAAPELLSALQSVVRAAATETIIAGMHKRSEGIALIEQCRAALAKATGN